MTDTSKLRELIDECDPSSPTYRHSAAAGLVTQMRPSVVRELLDRLAALEAARDELTDIAERSCTSYVVKEDREQRLARISTLRKAGTP